MDLNDHQIKILQMYARKEDVNPESASLSKQRISLIKGQLIEKDCIAYDGMGGVAITQVGLEWLDLMGLLD